MTCGNCGREIGGEARFCPYCGADPSAPGGSARIPTPGTPGYTGPEAPVGGGKKKGLLIGGAAAAVAAIALVVVMASGLFSSPKKQLEKAMIKSAAAYAAAWEALDLPDLDALTEERSVTQLISMELKELDTAPLDYDLSPLEGLGFRMLTDFDGSERVLGTELAAFWDEEDLISVQLGAEDNELYLASPQITGGTAYGVDTETLGADLAELTGDDQAADVSFNIFDLIDILAPEGRTEELRQSMKDANKALFDAVQVEKGGKEKISVNQNEISAALYRVTVPQEALDDHIDAVIPVLLMHYLGFYEEAVLSLGVPIGDVDGIPVFSGLTYSNLIDALHYAVEELGDLKLAVYVGGGYVSSVVYEGYLFEDDTSVKLSLFLGGGEEYVDDLRLEVQVDGQMVVIIDSTGDHGCKQGSFTDETTIRGAFTTVTSQLSFVPYVRGLSDNFTWEVTAPGTGGVEMSGTVAAGEDSLEVHLDELTVDLMGLDLVTLKMDYQVGPCRGQYMDLTDARLIGEMGPLGLMGAAMEIQSSVQTWAEEMEALFTARLPEELLRGITSGVF